MLFKIGFFAIALLIIPISEVSNEIHFDDFKLNWKKWSINKGQRTKYNDYVLSDLSEWAGGWIIKISKDELTGYVVNIPERGYGYLNFHETVVSTYRSNAGGKRDWILPTKEKFDLIRKNYKFQTMVDVLKGTRPETAAGWQNYWIYAGEDKRVIFNTFKNQYETVDDNFKASYFTWREYGPGLDL